MPKLVENIRLIKIIPKRKLLKISPTKIPLALFNKKANLETAIINNIERKAKFHLRKEK